MYFKEKQCFIWIFDFNFTTFFLKTTRTVCTCLSANNIGVNIEPGTQIFYWSSQLETVKEEHVWQYKIICKWLFWTLGLCSFTGLAVKSYNTRQKSDDAGSLNVTLADDVKSNRTVPGDEAKPQLLQKLKVNLTVWTPAQGDPIIDMLLVRQPILGPHFLTIITPEQKSVGLVFSFCCLFFFLLCGTWCLVYGTSTALTSLLTLLPCLHCCLLLFHVLWMGFSWEILPGDVSWYGRTLPRASLFRISATEWICLIV